jgi:hypothetical protein
LTKALTHYILEHEVFVALAPKTGGRQHKEILKMKIALDELLKTKGRKNWSG